MTSWQTTHTDTSMLQSTMSMKRAMLWTTNKQTNKQTNKHNQEEGEIVQRKSFCLLTYLSEMMQWWNTSSLSKSSCLWSATSLYLRFPTFGASTWPSSSTDIPGGEARGNFVTTSGSTGGAPPPTKTSIAPEVGFKWIFSLHDSNIIHIYKSALSFELDHLSIWEGASNIRTFAMATCDSWSLASSFHNKFVRRQSSIPYSNKKRSKEIKRNDNKSMSGGFIRAISSNQPSSWYSASHCSTNGICVVSARK